MGMPILPIAIALLLTGCATTPHGKVYVTASTDAKDITNPVITIGGEIDFLKHHKNHEHR